MNDMNQKKFGYAAVLGLPNAGKSTLINALVGEKVTIVSRKAQTTRMQIKGIALHETAQIVLIDTPGVFKAKRTFDRGMVEAAWAGLDEADICLLIVDCARKDAINSQKPLLERLKESNKPKWLVLNKVDAIKKEKLFDITAQLNAILPFDQTFMISALKGSGVEHVKQALANSMPVQPWMYDEDQLTDIPQKVMAAEITREQVYDKLHDELPYAIHVETEKWENFDNGDIKLTQIIYVQRDTQKAIVLGKGGAQIKQLGALARAELSDVFGAPVHLNLFVKVKENWQDNPDIYAAFN